MLVMEEFAENVSGESLPLMNSTQANYCIHKASKQGHSFTTICSNSCTNGVFPGPLLIRLQLGEACVHTCAPARRNSTRLSQSARAHTPTGAHRRDNARAKTHTTRTPSYREHALSANKFFITMSVFGHGAILIFGGSRLD